MPTKKYSKKEKESVMCTRVVAAGPFKRIYKVESGFGCQWGITGGIFTSQFDKHLLGGQFSYDVFFSAQRKK